MQKSCGETKQKIHKKRKKKSCDFEYNLIISFM